MMTVEQIAMNSDKELDCNLESMPSAVAFLIHDLRNFEIYNTGKKASILERAIEMLYKGQ